MKLLVYVLVLTGVIYAEEDKKVDKRGYLTRAAQLHEVGHPVGLIAYGNGLGVGGAYPSLSPRITYVNQPVTHATPVTETETEAPALSKTVEASSASDTSDTTRTYDNTVEQSYGLGLTHLLGYPHSGIGYAAAPILHARAPIVQTVGHGPIIYGPAPIVHRAPIIKPAIPAPVVSKTIISAIVPALAVEHTIGYGDRLGHGHGLEHNLGLGLGYSHLGYANLGDTKYIIKHI
ncbi:hypothetical protein RI129_007378 [Pyrocoelia pectoralis]|uniref:Cuticle protein n=1 Tax=Pyrocoelia pectoralis TaxID=417401 RepID=A0AAN7VDZ2_9COLE